jgi:hypothetical protein
VLRQAQHDKLWEIEKYLFLPVGFGSKEQGVKMKDWKIRPLTSGFRPLSTKKTLNLHNDGANVQKFGLWFLHLSIIFTHPQNFEVLE